MTTVAKHEQQLGHRQLHENDAENEQDARTLSKCLRLVDPKLDDRRRQKKERDNKVLRRFRLLPADHEKGESANKGNQDENFYGQGVLENAEQFIAVPATPRFLGSES